MPEQLLLEHIIVCLAEGRESVRPAGKMIYEGFAHSQQKGANDKTSRIKNPINIVDKFAGYDIWRQNLAWYKISTNKTHKWLIGDRLK